MENAFRHCMTRSNIFVYEKCFDQPQNLLKKHVYPYFKWIIMVFGIRNRKSFYIITAWKNDKNQHFIIFNRSSQILFYTIQANENDVGNLYSINWKIRPFGISICAYQWSCNVLGTISIWIRRIISLKFHGLRFDKQKLFQNLIRLFEFRN